MDAPENNSHSSLILAKQNSSDWSSVAAPAVQQILLVDTAKMKRKLKNESILVLYCYNLVARVLMLL